MLPIFLSSDENYAKYLTVTLQSIIANTKEKISVYVLDGGISEVNKTRIQKMITEVGHNIEFIEMDFSLFENLPVVRHFSLNSYFRYLIPTLNQKIKKALYVDTDMVIEGDVKEIFDIDLEGKGLGATAYMDEDMNKNVYADYKEKLSLPQTHRYFNSGLLLINCDYWRNNQITEKLFQKTNELKNIIKMQDQDILNLVFKEDYKELPAQYNLVVDLTADYKNFNSYLSSLKGCFVLHFTGGRDVRPWMKSNVPGEKYFWKYAKQTFCYGDLKQELFENQLALLSYKIESAFPQKKELVIKLFDLIPLFKIISKNNKKRIYLFNIPLFLIKEK